MADIDRIISGVSGNTRADFSGIGKLPDALYKSRDEAFKQEGRDLFKDGVPKNPDGSINYGAMRDALFRHGDVGSGSAIDTLGLNRDRLKYGMDAAQQDFPSEQPAQAPLVSPPSANRSGNTPVAPPLNRGGTQAPQGQYSGGDSGTSIVSMVSSGGIPEELAGPIIQQVSAATRTDPNAPVDPKIAPRVQQVVQAAIARARGGQQPPQAQQQQQQPVQAAQAAPAGFDERFQGATTSGLVPAGRTPQQQLDLLSRRVASGLLAPEVAKVYETRIKALQDAISPTPDMKNAAASGKTLEDYQSQGDERTTQRAILTGSLLPKLDKSQEQASAAGTDIDAIHRSREELDRGGTEIFSGKFADKRLQLAKLQKLAGFLGVEGAEKIEKTEAFGAAIGARVAAMVKAFGSGTAISDGDRRFAAAMSGGEITLDEKSIRRILDIGERAGRLVIDKHNKSTDKIVGTNDDLKSYRDAYIVTAPGEYKKPKAPAGTAAPPMEGAKQAPDGNFYVPDPDRPGKYFKVIQ